MKILYKPKLIITILFFLVFTQCKTRDQKEANAVTDVQEAKLKLKEIAAANKDGKQKTANEEEWVKFRSEIDGKIRQNDEMIKLLKAKMIDREKKLGDHYAIRMDSLNAKSKSLKNRLDRYEYVETDWQTIRAEFNRDLDQLGKSLKDFAVDNK